MPASLKRIRETGRSVLLTKCEVCGADGPFGYNVDLWAAFRRLEAGDIGSAKLLLGQWYCLEHREKTT